MAEQQASSGAMRAVTISREYGSGGGEVAARLATRLGWRLVDHEVVVQVAHALGVTEDEATNYDEHAEGLGERLLRSLQAMTFVAPVATGEALAGQEDEGHRYQAALHLVVENAAREGDAVIVGRGAQVLLGSRRDVLHARIVAPLERRIEYVATREGLDAAQARARIELKDRDRARYLQANYHRTPGDPHLYDIVVNTGVLAIDDAVDLLAVALTHKVRRLGLPEAALGPGAGIQRYPGIPGDLRPPQQAEAEGVAANQRAVP
jgi:cytidylate kinase